MFYISFCNLYIFIFRWACCYFIYYLCCLCCCRRFCNYRSIILSYFFNKILSSILSSGPCKDYS